MDFVTTDTLWEMRLGEDGYNRVTAASDDIKKNLDAFIGGIVQMPIQLFDTTGLQGNYLDFYTCTSGGTATTLSYNEQKLRGFCGWVNRITN